MTTSWRHIAALLALSGALALSTAQGAPLPSTEPLPEDIPEAAAELSATSEETMETDSTQRDSASVLVPDGQSVDEICFLAVDAILPLLQPDVTNGLIRLTLLPLRPVGEISPALTEAFTRKLEAQLRLQPHILSPPPAQVRSVSASLDGAGLRPLSAAQVISTARLLGSRYLLRGSLTKNNEGARLRLELFSVRQRASLLQRELPLSNETLMRFSVETLDPRTRNQTTLRSLLLPGWGQIHHGDVGRGVLYGALSLGLFSAALGSTFIARSATERYQRNEAKHLGALDEANRWYGHANILWLGLGTVWGASILDAWLTSRDETRLRIQLDPQGGAWVSGQF